MTTTLTAQDLFRTAYENRYTWDSQFPGYEADVTLKMGDETHTGKVKINADLSFEVSGIDDEDSKRIIQNQLWEITIHRVNHSFEKTHGENTFSFGQIDEDGTVEIILGGASEGNRYKVRDDIVCFVHRQIGNKIVNINTYKTLMTEKGYLAQGYDSLYIDPQTGKPLGTKTTFEDSFEKVEDYYILNRRIIHSESENQPQTKDISFSNIHLLKKVIS